MSGLPHTLDLRLLGACNLRCPFCFGPRHEIGARYFDDFIGLVNQLPAQGVKAIVITGGEPLLISRLPELLSVARSRELEIVLSTNAILLPKRANEILPFVDWVALPLDGPTEEIHSLLRPGPPSFQSSLNALVLIQSHYPEVSVKLGTVVTRDNHASVHLIPGVVSQFGRPATWKIYETCLTSYGFDNQNVISLSEDLFREATARSMKSANALGWNAIDYGSSERDGMYLFIEPNGDAMTIGEGREMIFGNVFEDLAEVVRVCRKFVNFGKVRTNYLTTYARKSSYRPPLEVSKLLP